MLEEKFDIKDIKQQNAGHGFTVSHILEDILDNVKRKLNSFLSPQEIQQDVLFQKLGGLALGLGARVNQSTKNLAIVDLDAIDKIREETHRGSKRGREDELEELEELEVSSQSETSSEASLKKEEQIDDEIILETSSKMSSHSSYEQSLASSQPVPFEEMLDDESDERSSRCGDTKPNTERREGPQSSRKTNEQRAKESAFADTIQAIEEYNERMGLNKKKEDELARQQFLRDANSNQKDQHSSTVVSHKLQQQLLSSE